METLGSGALRTSEPVWSRDGGELFYRNRRGYMVAVRVETESGFSARETTTLFADTGSSGTVCVASTELKRLLAK